MSSKIAIKKKIWLEHKLIKHASNHLNFLYLIEKEFFTLLKIDSQNQ